jgi:acyl-CoA reductase-like NAD-dependent aldehyde dehydrogenase
VLVQQSIHDDVVRRIADSFAERTIGPGLANPDVGPLVSRVQKRRVMSYLDQAQNEATVIQGGTEPGNPDLRDGYFVAPTVIDGVDPESVLARDEIFGPVLVVSSFESDEEALSLANGTDYGLVASVWTANLAAAHSMASALKCGQVYLNCYGAGGGVEIPFGGYKSSGYGREKGVEALRSFTQIKAVVLDS